MKKIKSKYSKDSELLECIHSAYTDLHILLQGAFINISKLPNQLTIIEFSSLLETYDWNDIFDNLEKLENETNLFNVESVYSIILENLKSNIKIKPLTDPRDNTYFKVWAGLMTDQDF